MHGMVFRYSALLSIPPSLRLPTHCGLVLVMCNKNCHHWFNPCGVKPILGNIKKALIFYHFSSLVKFKWMKSSIMECKETFIVHDQYHCCWCPGDVRHQGISSHGIFAFSAPEGLNNGSLSILNFASPTVEWVSFGKLENLSFGKSLLTYWGLNKMVDIRLGN